MQASDLPVDEKKSLHTALKCIIPVSILAALALICYCMPDEATRRIGLLLADLDAALGAAVVKFGPSVLQVINTAIYPIAAVSILAFLWNACAINHLKSKGLTGRVYVKLVNSYKGLVYTNVFVGGLYVILFVLRVREVTIEEFTNGLCWCVSIALVLIVVGAYTADKNDMQL
jgi:hypothetical protein